MRVRAARPARTRADAPAAVLMDGQTASSGEMTALRFVGRPNTRTFGAPTYGVTTGNEDYVLADGAALFITVSRMKDRTGRAYGGPIPPDEPVEPAEAATLAEDPVVRAALAWLGRQPACAER